MNGHSVKLTPYPIPEVCRHCGADVVFTSNAAVYGKKYGNGKCYKCTKCDSYVGVHDGTNVPLGILANMEERELKRKCHVLFDPVWKNNARINRDQAYGRLASVLGIPISKCHFGHFDKNMLYHCLTILKREKWYIGVNCRRECA